MRREANMKVVTPARLALFVAWVSFANPYRASIHGSIAIDVITL